MGFVWAGSEESGACVRVSWTYLNISRGSTFLSGRTVRLRAGLKLQGGEEPLQTDLAAAADRAGDNDLEKYSLLPLLTVGVPF